MMLYQRIIIKVFCLLMISGLVGILGVIVVGGGFVEAREEEKRKDPREIKQKQSPVVKGNLCNEGCVNLKVTTSCIVDIGGIHYEQIEICTREDTYLNTNYKCNKYKNYCFPSKCDQDGNFCSIACYTDHNCQSPGRCIQTYGSGSSGKRCKVPTLTCNNDELSNGIHTVSCHPYKCKSEPFPSCVVTCQSAAVCSEGYSCSVEGFCVPSSFKK